MELSEADPRPGDGLLIVDVQRDFCPGGALAVPEGDRVVAPLNGWAAAMAAAGLPIYASRDWHPRPHPSFEPQGGPWPVHCVQDTPGAAFHPDLALPKGTVVVTKGTRFDRDQNSAFDGTGLEAELTRRGVRRLLVGGLALDVCVQDSAEDARKLGFEVVLLAEACRAISGPGREDALAALARAGVARVG